MPPRPTVCAFCGQHSATLSGEHIWDDWVSSVFSKEANLKKFHLADFDETGDPIRAYSAASINKKAKVVCELCNNEWMSDLTNETRTIAKDMIVHGTRKKLLRGDIETLAAFAYMKSVVIDHLATNRTPFWPLGIRQRFKSNREIPLGVQIWIASFVDEHAKGHVWSIYSQPQDRPFFGSEFYTMTYHVGFLVLQLTAMRWTRFSRRNESLPAIRQNQQAWDRVSVDIWPFRGLPITWPYPKYLDIAGLLLFRQRWRFLKHLVGFDVNRFLDLSGRVTGHTLVTGRGDHLLFLLGPRRHAPLSRARSSSAIAPPLLSGWKPVKFGTNSRRA